MADADKGMDDSDEIANDELDDGTAGRPKSNIMTFMSATWFADFW